MELPRTFPEQETSALGNRLAMDADFKEGATGYVKAPMSCEAKEIMLGLVVEALKLYPVQIVLYAFGLAIDNACHTLFEGTHEKGGRTRAEEIRALTLPLVYEAMARLIGENYNGPFESQVSMSTFGPEELVAKLRLILGGVGVTEVGG